jgi:hypothetical protein
MRGKGRGCQNGKFAGLAQIERSNGLGILLLAVLMSQQVEPVAHIFHDGEGAV